MSTSWVLTWRAYGCYYVRPVSPDDPWLGNFAGAVWSDQRRYAKRFASLDAARTVQDTFKRGEVAIVKLTPRCPTKAARLDGPGGGDEFCRCTKPRGHDGNCVCDHGFTIGEERRA